MPLFWNHIMKHRYPIGTKIIYRGKSNGDWWRDGWEGIIVGTVNELPLIYLPKSIFESGYSTTECRVTVQTSWNNLELLPRKNQQLLFEFMY